MRATTRRPRKTCDLVAGNDLGVRSRWLMRAACIGLLISWTMRAVSAVPMASRSMGTSSLHGPTRPEQLENGAWWSAEDAVAWGRSHAEIVVIRIGDPPKFYSAGAREPEASPPLPRWSG